MEYEYRALVELYWQKNTEVLCEKRERVVVSTTNQKHPGLGSNTIPRVKKPETNQRVR